MQQSRAGNALHLTLRNIGGSVEHYHHFLLGFLVPLIAHWPELSAGGAPVLVRGCGILDPILHALRLPGLTILPPAEHAAALAKSPRHTSLNGLDFPHAYDAATFHRVRAVMFAQYAPEIAAAREALAPLFPPEFPRTAIIRRLPPDPFYASAESEAKTSGAQRRSIANFDTLCAALRADGISLQVITLEGKTLFYQIALFSMLDLVIAQHGAALSNLLWSRPGTRMIEIVPRELTTLLAQHDFMAALGMCLGVRCERVWQDLAHGPVDVSRVLALARQFQGSDQWHPSASLLAP
jgi:hypothetical protein